MPRGGAPTLKTMVQAAAGDLVEFGSMRSGRRPDIDEKARFYGEFKGSPRVVRGYKSGWIAHKFKERFGIWPDGWRSNGSRAPVHGDKKLDQIAPIAWANAGGGPMAKKDWRSSHAMCGSTSTWRRPMRGGVYRASP